MYPQDATTTNEFIHNFGESIWLHKFVEIVSQQQSNYELQCSLKIPENILLRYSIAISGRG
jgi:hypothetical protein